MAARLPLIIGILLVLCWNTSNAQIGLPKPQPKALPPLFSLEPADTFHKDRFLVAASAGATIYGVASLGLWKAWYADYEISSFHTFNDWGEWRSVDKAGHLFSAYMECNYAHQGARWTGMSRRASRWTSVAIGMGIQTTIEIMDGYSAEWGFSWSDMAFNGLGAGLFLAQDLAWGEQRIQMKVSGARPKYSSDPIWDVSHSQMSSLKERSIDLYGASPIQAFVKDYNAMTIWASANICSFSSNAKKCVVPPWLNIALGYGAGNIFGGYGNAWTTDEGAKFSLDPRTYPRYTQFYLSPDLDLRKIPTRKRWLKLALGVLNWVKVPAPAVEYNTMGRIRWHWLSW